MLLLIKLFSEGVIRVEVVDELLHPVHLNFECLGSFKVLTSDGLLFSLVKHCDVAANHLQLVSDLLILYSRIEVFLSHGLLLPLLQNIKLLLHFWVQLVFIDALDAEVARSKHRVVLAEGWHLTMLCIGWASCQSLGNRLGGISRLQRLHFIVS